MQSKLGTFIRNHTFFIASLKVKDQGLSLMVLCNGKVHSSIGLNLFRFWLVGVFFAADCFRGKN